MISFDARYFPHSYRSRRNRHGIRRKCFSIEWLDFPREYRMLRQEFLAEQMHSSRLNSAPLREW